MTMRRPWSSVRVLQEATQMMLACVFELLEYTLPHKLSPAKFAALAVAETPSTATRLLEELNEEWNLVLSMEAHHESAQLLHSQCRYVRNQSFRKMHCCLEKNRNTLSPELKSTILAWHPPLQSSSNLENVFGDIESAIRRSSRADAGSLANMMAVAIRGLTHRMDTEETGQPLVLNPEISGLKNKIWSPASAAPCS